MYESRCLRLWRFPWRTIILCLFQMISWFLPFISFLLETERFVFCHLSLSHLCSCWTPALKQDVWRGSCLKFGCDSQFSRRHKEGRDWLSFLLTEHWKHCTRLVALCLKSIWYLVLKQRKTRTHAIFLSSVCQQRRLTVTYINYACALYLSISCVCVCVLSVFTHSFSNIRLVRVVFFVFILFPSSSLQFCLFTFLPTHFFFPSFFLFGES